MLKLSLLGTVFLLMATACAGAPADSTTSDQSAETADLLVDQGDYEIITLLPPDAISSIDDPQFYGVDQADLEYEPEETVIGLEINGDARAYSTSLLSSHEIVNDEVNGHPIAVTW